MERIKEYEKWLRSASKTNGDSLMDSTIERYIENIRPHIKNFSSSPSEIVDYMNEVMKRGGVVLHASFYNYLMSIGQEPKDEVMIRLKSPKKRANSQSSIRFLQSKVLSRGELKRLFMESNEEFRLIFSLLYDTACRRSEFLNIKWKDVIFYKNPEGNLFGEIPVLGKGAKGRTVYFGRLTNQLLREKQKQTDCEYVVRFKNNKGIPYQKQDSKLYKEIRNSSDNILGRRIHPHCFRHTKCTHMADLGADILKIKAYAGHDSVKTTQKYIEISTFQSKNAFNQYSQDIVEAEF